MTDRAARIRMSEAHGAVLSVEGCINMARICLDDMDLHACRAYIRQALNSIPRLRDALIAAGVEVEE